MRWILLECIQKDQEKIKNLVCDFNISNDVHGMEKLTHNLNQNQEELKKVEEHEQRLREIKIKYIYPKRERLSLLHYLVTDMKFKDS